jgi:hypothetical protein
VSNSEILQFEVDDVRKFFRTIEAQGAIITGGSSYDKKGGFWFGSFAVKEGNPFWVVDKIGP